MKIANQLSLKEGDYPGFSGSADPVIPWSLKVEEGGRGEGQNSAFREGLDWWALKMQEGARESGMQAASRN